MKCDRFLKPLSKSRWARALCLAAVLGCCQVTGTWLCQPAHAQQDATKAEAAPCIPNPTGDLLGDGDFEKWGGGKPSYWAVSDTKAVRPAEGEGSGAVISVSAGNTVKLRQYPSPKHLRPGDMLYLRLRVRSPSSGEVTLFGRVYDQANNFLATVSTSHVGDGTWHTLAAGVHYPESGQAITVGVTAGTTQGSPIDIEIAHARAYVVPPVP